MHMALHCGHHLLHKETVCLVEVVGWHFRVLHFIYKYVIYSPAYIHVLFGKYFFYNNGAMALYLYCYSATMRNKILNCEFDVRIIII